MPAQPADRRVAYSTDSGSVRYCRRCGQPAHEGACRGVSSATAASRAPSDGIVRVSRETKHRRGKAVTIVSGLPGTDDERDAVAQTLKKLCGAGGARKDDVIEIQGDQRTKIADYLAAQGYRVKLAGG